MNTTFVLAPVCANGFTMPASLIYGCSNSDYSGYALWYAASLHGFCSGCCSVRTSLPHVGCRCGGAVLCNVDAGVMRLVCNGDDAGVRSRHYGASTFIRSYVATDVTSVHHRACRLRCKVFATGVAMLLSSAASAKQYACVSFALLFGLDADMRDTDVRGFSGITGRCVSHDARNAVGGEISKHARTCFSEYLQCDDLTFPNFKATASSRLKPHAKSTVRILMNMNQGNFSKGNVGSRLGATEWTGRLRKCPKIACWKCQKVSKTARE